MDKLYKGEYSLNKVGRGVKVSIPQDILHTWGLKPKDKVHLYFDKGYLIISKEKISDDVGINKKQGP